MLFLVLSKSVCPWQTFPALSNKYSSLVQKIITAGLDYKGVTVIRIAVNAYHDGATTFIRMTLSNLQISA
jgi:hypothetical protein